MSPIIKLIALDLDGTLFTDSLTITEENKKILKEASAAGIHVIISTGRPYCGLPVKELTELGIRYVITTNGGGIYRIPEKECVFSNCMPPELVLPIIQYFQTKDVLFDAFIEGVRYRQSNCQYLIEHLTHFPEATRDFLKNNASFVDNLASFIEEHSYHIEKMTINFSPLSNGEYKDREDIWNYLSENPQLTTVSGGYKNLEFTMCGTTKAIGLQFLADMLQVPMECTMACGDSQNDIDILQAAAVGVVMENASDNLKSIADFITKSNNDSGVAYAIKQLVLNHS